MSETQSINNLHSNKKIKMGGTILFIISIPFFLLGQTFHNRDMSYLVDDLQDKGVQFHSYHHDIAAWGEYLKRPHPTVETLNRFFEEAAQEFNVPVDLLKAIGLVETNWTQIGPSIDQGWGILHLVENDYAHTLSDAAKILEVSHRVLQEDARMNIRGGAALLAYVAGIDRMSFTKPEDWFDAVKIFTGLISGELRELQAQQYYDVLKNGRTSETIWGEKIVLSPHNEINIEPKLKFIKPRSDDYSGAIENLTPCNYTTGRNHIIDTWTNHWIGVGTYAGAISWFHNCEAYASAHFVIRASDGEITQVVLVANTAWHAGASGYPHNNSRSIGVEHEATITHPEYWNSIPMLQASTDMALFFCDQYDIPKVRDLPGIRGHQEMPGTATDCPGNLPWEIWMAMLNAPPEILVEINMELGWNLIGLPVEVNDSHYLTLFPDAVEESLYSFSDVYSSEDTLENGIGYWLYFENADTVSIFGTAINEVTIQLIEGWNLISGVSTPVNTETIVDTGELIISNSIYTFDVAYDTTNVLMPGLGYWLRSNGDGVITLNGR